MNGDRSGIGEAIQERSDTENMVAVAVGNIDRGQFLAARHDPIHEGVRLLEEHDLVAVEVGHSDTDHTTILHVPSVGLVVAGDVAYNDVHLWLGESNAQTRREWISALDTIDTVGTEGGTRTSNP